MKRTQFVGTAAVTLAIGVAAAGLASTSAQAHSHKKPKSLASVLTADHNRFDKTPGDFDVATEAVLAVLAAKPNSAVGVLTKPSVKLTAFIPTDAAFRRLAQDLKGMPITSEQQAFNIVAKLGIDTVETVLLYHVVPGAKINSAAALRANGAELTTASGGKFKVSVTRGPKIALVDQDRNAANPQVILRLTNINSGAINKQIAHGINQVLRPVDLPPTVQ